MQAFVGTPTELTGRRMCLQTGNLRDIVACTIVNCTSSFFSHFLLAASSGREQLRRESSGVAHATYCWSAGAPLVQGTLVGKGTEGREPSAALKGQEGYRWAVGLRFGQTTDSSHV